MKKLCSAEIAHILGYEGELTETEITEVSTDSRKIDAHTLFIALKGERFDGHDFIKDVLAAGAPLVVAEHIIEGVNPKQVIVVQDTLKALGALAQHNRRQYRGTLIALTGSSGKTTTKEELKAALSVYAPTYATSGNFNNHIGVPRSLLDLDMSAPYAVIEMGMSAAGELSYLTHLAEPDIAMVINVYPMHIEFLGSISNIARAKAEIFSGLRQGGTAIYNADTAHADILKEAAMQVTDKVLAYNSDMSLPEGLNLTGNSETALANARAVLAVISALGLDPTRAISAINQFTTPEGRGKHHHLNLNGKNVTLIDDSYSGQPDAMKFAIRSLGKMPVRGRRIALLGKMAELGDYSKQAHVEVGQVLAEEKIDVVIGVCEETKDMLAQLPLSTEQYYFPSIEGVEEFLLEKLHEGDVLLIKGAHYSSRVFVVASALIKLGSSV